MKGEELRNSSRQQQKRKSGSHVSGIYTDNENSATPFEPQKSYDTRTNLNESRAIFSHKQQIVGVGGKERPYISSRGSMNSPKNHRSKSTFRQEKLDTNLKEFSSQLRGSTKRKVPLNENQSYRSTLRSNRAAGNQYQNLNGTGSSPQKVPQVAKTNQALQQSQNLEKQYADQNSKNDFEQYAFTMPSMRGSHQRNSDDPQSSSPLKRISQRSMQGIHQIVVVDDAQLLFEVQQQYQSNRASAGRSGSRPEQATASSLVQNPGDVTAQNYNLNTVNSNQDGNVIQTDNKSRKPPLNQNERKYLPKKKMSKICSSEMLIVQQTGQAQSIQQQQIRINQANSSLGSIDQSFSTNRSTSVGSSVAVDQSRRDSNYKDYASEALISKHDLIVKVHKDNFQVTEFVANLFDKVNCNGLNALLLTWRKFDGQLVSKIRKDYIKRGTTKAVRRLFSITRYRMLQIRIPRQLSMAPEDFNHHFHHQHKDSSVANELDEMIKNSAQKLKEPQTALLPVSSSKQPKFNSCIHYYKRDLSPVKESFPQCNVKTPYRQNFDTYGANMMSKDFKSQLLKTMGPGVKCRQSSDQNRRLQTFTNHVDVPLNYLQNQAQIGANIKDFMPKTKAIQEPLDEEISLQLREEKQQTIAQMLSESYRSQQTNFQLPKEAKRRLQITRLSTKRQRNLNTSATSESTIHNQRQNDHELVEQEEKVVNQRVSLNKIPQKLNLQNQEMNKSTNDYQEDQSKGGLLILEQETYRENLQSESIIPNNKVVAGRPPPLIRRKSINFQNEDPSFSPLKGGPPPQTSYQTRLVDQQNSVESDSNESLSSKPPQLCQSKIRVLKGQKSVSGGNKGLIGASRKVLDKKKFSQQSGSLGGKTSIGYKAPHNSTTKSVLRQHQSKQPNTLVASRQSKSKRVSRHVGQNTSKDFSRNLKNQQILQLNSTESFMDANLTTETIGDGRQQDLLTTQEQESQKKKEEEVQEMIHYGVHELEQRLDSSRRSKPSEKAQIKVDDQERVADDCVDYQIEQMEDKDEERSQGKNFGDKIQEKLVELKKDQLNKTLENYQSIKSLAVQESLLNSKQMASDEKLQDSSQAILVNDFYPQKRRFKRDQRNSIEADDHQNELSQIQGTTEKVNDDQGSIFENLPQNQLDNNENKEKMQLPKQSSALKKLKSDEKSSKIEINIISERVSQRSSVSKMKISEPILKNSRLNKAQLNNQGQQPPTNSFKGTSDVVGVGGKMFAHQYNIQNQTLSFGQRKLVSKQSNESLLAKDIQTAEQILQHHKNSPLDPNLNPKRLQHQLLGNKFGSLEQLPTSVSHDLSSAERLKMQPQLIQQFHDPPASNSKQPLTGEQKSQFLTVKNRQSNADFTPTKDADNLMSPLLINKNDKLVPTAAKKAYHKLAGSDQNFRNQFVSPDGKKNVRLVSAHRKGNGAILNQQKMIENEQHPPAAISSEGYLIKSMAAEIQKQKNSVYYKQHMPSYDKNLSDLSSLAEKLVQAQSKAEQLSIQARQQNKQNQMVSNKNLRGQQTLQVEPRKTSNFFVTNTGVQKSALSPNIDKLQKSATNMANFTVYGDWKRQQNFSLPQNNQLPSAPQSQPVSVMKQHNNQAHSLMKMNHSANQRVLISKNNQLQANKSGGGPSSQQFYEKSLVSGHLNSTLGGNLGAPNNTNHLSQSKTTSLEGTTTNNQKDFIINATTNKQLGGGVNMGHQQSDLQAFERALLTSQKRSNPTTLYSGSQQMKQSSNSGQAALAGSVYNSQEQVNRFHHPSHLMMPASYNKSVMKNNGKSIADQQNKNEAVKAYLSETPTQMVKIANKKTPSVVQQNPNKLNKMVNLKNTDRLQNMQGGHLPKLV